MEKGNNNTAGLLPRFDGLDGLRGIAALCVLWYHITDDVWFATESGFSGLFHGYLAVDFFFILSGFVMGYAYDTRWKQPISPASPVGPLSSPPLTLWSFIRRRLIRLHPMVVAGVLLSLVIFLAQGHMAWDRSVVGMGTILGATLLSLFLLPVPPSLDVRGYQELFPLNGPHWSLFFEYLGSLMYALFIRRMKAWVLAIAVVFFGMTLFWAGNTMGDGSIAFGWSSEPHQILLGFLRMAFGYSLGMLLSRASRRIKMRGHTTTVFCLLSLFMVASLGVGQLEKYNVCFEMLMLILVFPAVVLIMATLSGSKSSSQSNVSVKPNEQCQTCLSMVMARKGGMKSNSARQTINFLGRLSYPLYATHYAFISMFIWWVKDECQLVVQYPVLSRLAVCLVAILTATLFMLLYDEPLRRKLTKHYGQQNFKV